MNTKQILTLVWSLAFIVGIILSPVEAKVFSGHSYSFTYPNGCKPDKDTNKYSNSITLECKEDMLMQLNSGGITGDDLSSSTEDSLADDMLTAFDNGWENVNEIERGNMTVGNGSAPFVIATYTQTYNNLFGFQSDREEEFVVMLIAIKIGDGYVVGQYKNNAGDFDKGRSIAEKIFSSITPSTNANTTQYKQSQYEKCQNEKQDKYENLKDFCGDPA